MTGVAVAPQQAMPTLSEVARATEIRFSQADRSIIRDAYCKGASKEEFRQLLRVAEVRGLSPFKDQCHFVKRWDSDLGREVWSVQVSIDGMRGRAESSGLYDGQDEPEFQYEKNGSSLRLARVKVYRKDWNRPAVGVAYWAEYVQTKRDGSVTYMWKTKPHIMLAKCAEAAALAKAFPEKLGGLSLFNADESATDSEVNDLVERIAACKNADELRAVSREIQALSPQPLNLDKLRAAYGKRRAELESRSAQPAEPPPPAEAPSPPPPTPTPPPQPAREQTLADGQLVAELALRLSKAAGDVDALQTVCQEIAEAYANNELLDEERKELLDIYNGIKSGGGGDAQGT